jgi:hypothetical protein
MIFFSGLSKAMQKITIIPHKECVHMYKFHSGEWRQAVYRSTSGLERVEPQLEFPACNNFACFQNWTGSLCHGDHFSVPRAENPSVALLAARIKTPDPLSRWLAADPDPVTVAVAVAASGRRAVSTLYSVLFLLLTPNN